MKTLISMVAAAGLVVIGASAASASYCSDKAKQEANAQAAKKTIVGGVGGCVVAKVLGGKCGTGVAVGGIGGFAIGSAKWQQVYDDAYNSCIAANSKTIYVKKVYTVPAPGTPEWYDACDAKYNSFDRDTGYYTRYDGTLAVCKLP
ncbi:MAG TPA: hypothetical protein VFB16_13160 [Bauldia sp.]|nr:hypothetical protein [Bauldia sp.]